MGLTQSAYTSVFNDITSGSNGNRLICSAAGGCDAVTCLGTPNSGSLLSTLVGI